MQEISVGKGGRTLASDPSAFSDRRSMYGPSFKFFIFLGKTSSPGPIRQKPVWNAVPVGAPRVFRIGLADSFSAYRKAPGGSRSGTKLTPSTAAGEFPQRMRFLFINTKSVAWLVPSKKRLAGSLSPNIIFHESWYSLSASSPKNWLPALLRLQENQWRKNEFLEVLRTVPNEFSSHAFLKPVRGSSNPQINKALTFGPQMLTRLSQVWSICCPRLMMKNIYSHGCKFGTSLPYSANIVVSSILSLRPVYGKKTWINVQMQTQ